MNVGTCCTNLKNLFHKCSFLTEILMRGHQIILPEILQPEAIRLAHEGQMGADKTLNLVGFQICQNKFVTMLKHALLVLLQ